LSIDIYNVTVYIFIIDKLYVVSPNSILFQDASSREKNTIMGKR